MLRNPMIRDTEPDPIDELGLTDEEFRAVLGATSIEDAVERLVKQATAAVAVRRPVLA